jgi:CDP-diacylglycerol--serine O-phosphatidyltransferase
MDQAIGFELAVPLAIITALIALLMVSNVRYYSPKHIDLNGRVPFFYMFVIVVLFGVVTVYPPGMLLTIGVVYSLSGPLTVLLRRKFPSATSAS